MKIKGEGNEDERGAVDQLGRSTEQDLHPDFIHPTDFEPRTLEEDYIDQSQNTASNESIINLDTDAIVDDYSLVGNQQNDDVEYNSSLAEDLVDTTEIYPQDDSELFTSNNLDTPLQTISSQANTDWDFADATIDFDEIPPSEQESTQLLSEDSNLEEYSDDLARQYGYRKNSSRCIFHSILEDFPHYQSYLAISRLIKKEFSLEVIKDAYELKSVWVSSPDLWLRRCLLRSVSSHRNISSQLTWETCARLCSIFGLENTLNLISNFWKNEWDFLKQPEPLSDRETKNSYYYFVSFINYKTKLHISEFPINLTDQLSDEDNGFSSITEQKMILMPWEYGFGASDFDFMLDANQTLWHDMNF